MNITIYIRRELEDQFKAEPKKSELINNLLSDWYDGTIKNPLPQNQKPFVELPKTELLKDPNIKLASDAFAGKDIKFCSHGAAIGLCKKGCKK